MNRQKISSAAEWSDFVDLKVPGIHHVTSVVGDPQRDLDFYTGVLGLRPLKVTVNFDVPKTYHLYFGDHAGTPGTILTTFPWPRTRSGRIGAGQIGVTTFAVPEGSLEYWRKRLEQHDVETETMRTVFGEEKITFDDQDGLVNALVGQPGADIADAWHEGPVPAEHAITGFAGVTLYSRKPDETTAVMTDLLGFSVSAESQSLRRFTTGTGERGSTIDLLLEPPFDDGVEGPGTVHHVAWRTRDEAEQKRWRQRLTSVGLSVTPVRDRSYFKSIYFNEPGGILFEIATDPPGFAIDEPVESLASGVRLPPWYEDRRGEFERGLQTIRLPNGVTVP